MMQHTLLTSVMGILALGIMFGVQAHSGHAQAQEMTPYTDMPAGLYTLDKTHASLVWKVSHLGLSYYTARFTDFDVDLNFNPENPAASTLRVQVDPLSVRTDYPNATQKDFDQELATGTSWFNGTAFPEITFVATAINITGANTGTVTGDLTFLGVTKPLTLNVVFNGAYASKPFSENPALGFSATGTLKRSDWGLGTYVPVIGDDVELLIEAELEQFDS